MNEDKSKYELSGKTDVGGVDYNTAGLLCYLPVPPINLAASVCWLVTEPKSNTFVRFHAMQSIILFIGFMVVAIATSAVGALGMIPVIGWLFSVVSGLLYFAAALAWFGGSIMLLLKAKEREMYKLPVIGDLAEKYAS